MDHPIRHKVLGSVSITPRQMLFRGDSVTLLKADVPRHIAVMVEQGILRQEASNQLDSVIISFAPLGD